MANNILILVCNDGELELIYEVTNRLVGIGVAVIGIPNPEEEMSFARMHIAHLEARDIPFIHTEPRYIPEGNEEYIDYKEIRNNRIIGIVGNQRLSPIKGHLSSLEELLLCEMEKTKEHIFTMRENYIDQLEYFFSDYKNDSQSWKDAEKNFLSKCGYESCKPRGSAHYLKHNRKITASGK